MSGLADLPKPILIRHDHAIALGRQGRDHVRPVIARKALGMQKHDGLAVCGSRWRDVHVRHAQLLAFDGDVKEPHRIWIFDPLKADADRLRKLLRGGRLGNRRLRHGTASRGKGAAYQRESGQQGSEVRRETTEHGRFSFLWTDRTRAVCEIALRPAHRAGRLRHARRALCGLGQRRG